MYVIFPADELILLTYGVAVPRVRTRPTLDNLREPLVPIGSRPSSNISQSRTLADHIQIENNTSAEIDNNNDNHPENFDPADFSYDCFSSNLLGTTDLKATSEINNCLNISSTTSTNKLNSTSATAATTAKGKKSKLKLKLRRLRPHSSAETTAETARIREDLQIHVTNPIFTRDNLRERNFDAFFECGETVYSLAIKDKQQLLPEPEPPPVDFFTSSDSQRPNSFGFFRKVKSPDTLKAKSADNILTAEESQKDPSRNRHRNLFKKKGAATITVPITTSGSSMSSSGGALKDLGHPSLNEALKTHNSVTFKLVKTVSDFTETLAQLYEQHAEALQALVSSYRKKNGELRKERPSCQSNLFHAWETYLQEIEADSQATVEVANALSRQVARPLLERSFHRKVQSRKVFTHRESFDTIISKTEEKLSKCRTEYKQCYIAHRQNPNQHSLTQYIDSHNAYVQQLHATNAMIESYHCETLPALLQELEEIYNDLCTIVTEAVLQGAQTISFKAIEQAKRYDGLAVQCKSVSSGQDLEYFVRSLQIPSVKIPKKNFAPPQPPTVSEADEYGEPSTPLLKNELIVEKGASLQVRPSLEALKRESQELEIQIKQLQDSVDGLVRTQIRGLEGQLYNKANELQEDISMKKFDLRAKQIHLSAVSAQKELFLGKIDLGSPRGERKMSSSSSSSMKTKWLKAFRSLKPTSTNERKNGNGAQARLESTDSHNLQEYTYKKITPCDVCSQVLRGHTRQGLRCRICKVNVHADCAPQVPPKCQMKQKLLRRQKSTPEIENRVDLEDEKPTHIDQVYQVLKKAGEISSGKQVESKTVASTGDSNVTNNVQLDIPTLKVPDYPDRTPRRGPVKSQGPNIQQKQGLTAPAPSDVTCSAPHSPRRQKLNLRMKSLSLDSPESTELHGQMRRRYPGPSYVQGGSGGRLEHNTPPSNNTPSSPSGGNQRRFLYASRGMKTGSVDLPDDIEKSLSSASTSPCPSPVRNLQKAHRLLPTNLYVVLYNFKSRHQDELDLKAGYKVTVIDTSDPDWWKGKCLGRIGYFPSKYCMKLAGSEKPLQVTHNLQVTDNERSDSTLTLLRDQIVIQIGEEVGGMVMIRAADNRQGICPVKYLQEV